MYFLDGSQDDRDIFIAGGDGDPGYIFKCLAAHPRKLPVSQLGATSLFAVQEIHLSGFGVRVEYFASCSRLNHEWIAEQGFDLRCF